MKITLKKFLCSSNINIDVIDTLRNGADENKYLCSRKMTDQKPQANNYVIV